MTDEGEAAADDLDALRARADSLEQQLRHVAANAEQRIVQAELKAEAVRAGMVDLDGLKLADLGAVRVNERGEVEGAAALMDDMRRSKPWLFGGQSSSSRAVAPPAHPPKPRLATEMTVEEYRLARAELLRRR